ncbi:MAG TPA: hypothetical protein VHG29_05160 [Novosphingobium sp.]|nr:hypothetical protein [Novosphingobium sp.]
MSADNGQMVIRELAIKEADRRWDEASERLKFSTEYAQAGLKGLFIANGAAIIALLTFLGNAHPSYEPRALWWSFVWFASGISCALAAYIAAYLSQAILMNASFSESRKAESAAYETGVGYDPSRFERNGERAASAGLWLAGLSLICFVVGAFVALDAIT